MNRRFRKTFNIIPGNHDSDGLGSVSADDPESQLALLRNVQHAHEAYASALSELKKANLEFGEKIVGPATRICKAELVDYMSAVVACVRVAETLYNACPDLPYFRVARTKCKSVSTTFELARAQFETTAGEGQLGTEAFATYTKALTAFVDSISEAQEVVANAITRGVGNTRRP